MFENIIENLLGAVMLILSLLVTAFIEIWQYIVISNPKKLKENTNIIYKKQAQREKQLQAIGCTYRFNPNLQKILKLSEEKLLEGLQNRKLKAVEVLEAFIAKSLQVTRQYNCITEYIPEALEWAKQLDSMDKVKGPLHGLPISIKEQIGIKGTDSSAGFAKFLFQPMERDAPIVSAMKYMGAIPFCKTNVPQSLFTYGCGNPIYGETMNCLNSKLAPGGSSGGEGCLIGGGGSILGIGTDVGGSIRIPAHFCGCTGMKPTKLRMSVEGLRTVGAVMVPIAGTTGFLAKNVKMLTIAYKALFSSENYWKLDPYIVPIPWNESIFSAERKLKFGYFTSLSYFPIIGDAEEVVMDAKSKLEAAGHKVVPFEMPDIDHIMRLTFDFAFADQGKVLTTIWKGEPLSDAAFATYWVNRLPLWLKKIMAFFIEFKLGSIRLPGYHSPLLAKLLRAGDATKTSFGLWEKIIERKIVMDSIKNQMVSNQIDVILSPAFPFPAPAYQIPGKVIQSVAYTMPWNMLDFPAGVVTFGKESGKLFDQFDHKNDYILRLVHEGLKESVGMPISVQIIGLPYQEEMVLKAMNILEELKS